MPYATSEPVAIRQANRWAIGDISIDPNGPALNYVVRAFLDNAEVERHNVGVTGAELMAVEGVPALYASIKALLYADAITRGLIPAAAEAE
jgi:hypothetical protein